MPFLFEKLDTLKAYGGYNDDLPSEIVANISPAFELRPYQRDAFTHFINYFENPKMRTKPTSVLYHMATGSGKTLIMAGLICYLYAQGYRNFLFFVNRDNIVQKTKDNFLNATSSKFLFADNIVIAGETIRVNEVANFQGCDSDAINICFTTVQGLHMAMWDVREGGISFDDFRDQKTVLIADEAHHLNVETRKGQIVDKDELELRRNWETTVNNIFYANNENILLEFTATCDLDNQYIKTAYESKIIFNYPLRRFREELFSKEIRTIRSEMTRIDRALLALMFSQYRLKVFQDHRLYAKPVVLFKSKTIKESNAFEQEFYSTIKTLSGSRLDKIVSGTVTLPEVLRLIDYLKNKNISLGDFATEMRDEFSEERCISVNSKDEANGHQIIVNSLEDSGNRYRVIFAVDMLNEGWDVLNLFDIVRLYETRDGKNNKPGKGTIAEAQLIGRGARYCPFVAEEGQEKHKRKYDKDLDNPLRVCEELYYHCQFDSKYITELRDALIATGIWDDKARTVTYELKKEFKKELLYKEGLVFANRRVIKSRKDVMELLPSIRMREYPTKVATGRAAADIVMEGEVTTRTGVKILFHRITVADIAKYNYSLVHAALRRFDAFKFSQLKDKFPNLKTLREFITDNAYLGGIKIVIESGEEFLTAEIYFVALVEVFDKIASEISAIREVWVGSIEYKDILFREVFKGKTLNITGDEDKEIGTSQARSGVTEAQMDLSAEDWYVFNDNYGTSEEKRFIKYFSTYVAELRKKYKKVFLVRNERQLKIYSEKGECFEPDFLLFLWNDKDGGYEQVQLFIEPKGTGFIANDIWKEEYLKQIASISKIVKTYADDNEYRVLGVPFYNHSDVERVAAIDAEIRKLLH